MNDENGRNDLKQTEKERIKAVRERIKNSKIFLDKTQPGKGTAIIGGLRQSSDDQELK